MFFFVYVFVFFLFPSHFIVRGCLWVWEEMLGCFIVIVVEELTARSGQGTVGFWVWRT